MNRLELGFSDLQRSQEAQAAMAASRAQTTGVLEEYRTRAQQALKRANEITSQTASENKRLEVGLAYKPPKIRKTLRGMSLFPPAKHCCLILYV